MNTEAEFVAAIAANPYDDLLRGAFADWLEERGDRRAPWVRSHHVLEWMRPNFEDPIPKLIASLKRRKRVIAVRDAAGAIGAAIVPDLVGLLSHEHPSVREQAIQCLRRVGKAAGEAIPALMEALKDEDPRVRAQAGNAIRRIGAKKGTDTGILREALSDSSGEVREKAAGILGGLGETGSVLAQLTARLEDADAGERLAAVAGLGSLKTPEAIVPLCRALADADTAVRERAVECLTGLVGPDTTEAVEPLRAALHDRSERVRQLAITALGQMRGAA